MDAISLQHVFSRNMRKSDTNNKYIKQWAGSNSFSKNKSDEEGPRAFAWLE